MKTYLRPAVATPGTPLQVEVVLTSRSETPIEYVESTLHGMARMQVGRYGSAVRLFEQQARHGPRTLVKGEHRFASRFEVPEGVPPTYSGAVARVEYALTVHVAIPWWPDRRQSFTVPMAATTRRDGLTPRVFVSSLDGPRGGIPFFELALESSELEIGGVLAGAASASNTGHSNIRALDLHLVSIETSTETSFFQETERARWRIHDGQPGEGQSIPFRVALPRDLQVPFAAPNFRVAWAVDLVADVVWGFDATLRAPVVLVPPPPSAPRGRAASAWVAPVGRERRAIAWSTVAERHGMANDAAEERMSAAIGAASLNIHTQHRGADGLYWVATLKWESLGIDLHAARRSWTDVFGAARIDLGETRHARRFTARAREQAQGRAILGEFPLRALDAFDEVTVTDDGATLASRARAETLTQLDAFVTGAIVAAQSLSVGIARLPPPESMAMHVEAWKAFASRTGGRLHVGPMRITSTSFGPAPMEIETLWADAGRVAATAVRVHLAPPLDCPVDLDSPSMSPEARQLAMTVAASARNVRLGPSVLEALLDGSLEDPATVEPLLLTLASLAGVLRGTPPTGPFR